MGHNFRTLGSACQVVDCLDHCYKALYISRSRIEIQPHSIECTLPQLEDIDYVVNALYKCIHTDWLVDGVVYTKSVEFDTPFYTLFSGMVEPSKCIKVLLSRIPDWCYIMSQPYAASVSITLSAEIFTMTTDPLVNIEPMGISMSITPSRDFQVHCAFSEFGVTALRLEIVELLAKKLSADLFDRRLLSHKIDTNC